MRIHRRGHSDPGAVAEDLTGHCESCAPATQNGSDRYTEMNVDAPDDCQVRLSALYTVAYPELSAADRAFIEAFRAVHDADHYPLIRAHFTLVFACEAVPLPEYLAHVASIAARTPPIRFTCTRAMLGAGDGSEVTHVFLVPDEGHTAISLLHDALYSGILEPYTRPDLPFTPHMTIATASSSSAATGQCFDLNSQGLAIQGLLTSLHVGSREESAFVHHGVFELRA
jgi:2'-5' RNA ligase